jgi:hypothetical protein
MLLMDVVDLIERAGGIHGMAAIANVNRTTVYDWKRFGFIPTAKAKVISVGLGVPLEDVIALQRLPGSASRRRDAA